MQLNLITFGATNLFWKLINKFIDNNTLLNQEWIMDPKKKVKDVLKEVAGKDKIEIKKFVRFKVGEGV